MCFGYILHISLAALRGKWRQACCLLLLPGPGERLPASGYATALHGCPSGGLPRDSQGLGTTHTSYLRSHRRRRESGTTEIPYRKAALYPICNVRIYPVSCFLKVVNSTSPAKNDSSMRCRFDIDNYVDTRCRIDGDMSPKSTN